MSLLGSIFRKLKASSPRHRVLADPARAAAAKLRGDGHLARGEFEQAAACYRDAVELNSGYAEAYNNLGFVLKEQQRFAEAAAMLDMALNLSPDLGPAYLNQGVVAAELERHDVAEECFRQAAARMPGMPECHWRLGNALFRQRRFEEALACYETALGIDPALPGIRVNVGRCHGKLGRNDAAEPHYRMALEQFLQADAAYLLGVCVEARGDADQARALYRQALALQPDYVQAHWNLALLSLLHGDYSRATWDHFERRLGVVAVNDGSMQLDDVKNYLPRFGSERYWDGADLRGKRLLVWAEQGLGDTLMTMRYLPLLKARGAAEVIVYADPPLVRIIETLDNVDRVVAKTDPLADDAFDLHVSTFSLPARFAAGPDSLAACGVPYLHVPAASVDRWSARCATLRGYRVGLVWGGNKAQPKDALRSIVLAAFAPLMALPGIDWVSLQKGEPAAQLKAGAWPINDWMDDCQDLLDTAALIANLDLVIGVDTAVVHLAGALGRPVWLLNRHESEWRWMLGRDDSPWYPTLRIFTQAEKGDWAAVLVRMRDELDATKLRTAPAAADFKQQGNAFLAAGDLARAAERYRLSIAADPLYADAYNNLGLVLRQQRRLAEARDCLEQALRLAPGLANAHYNLGQLMTDMGDVDAAQASLRQAHALDPTLVEKYCHAGNACYAEGRLDQAVENYRQALALKPDHAGAHNNLGVVQQAQGNEDEAATSYRAAIAYAPDFADAHRNLGVVLHHRGELEAAVASYDHALLHQPDYADARLNRGFALLALGRYAAGWLDCELRWVRPGREPLPATPYRVWQGEATDPGMRLLVQSEQGLGDTLQMVRYLAVLADRGIECWLYCPGPLQVLLQRSFPAAHVGGDPCPPGLDFRIPIMSLPLAMRTHAEEAIPQSGPYLVVDRARTAYWRERLAAPQRTQVGLVWRGSPGHLNDRNRSLGLARLLPLIGDHPAIRFVALQKGLTAEERGMLAGCGNVLALDAELVDFDETAAAISSLDVVISVDSSPAHLAGGLGRATWILLPFAADWRWLVDRQDSPWYPTASLFRQRAAGDWAEPIAAISERLRCLA
ncbi:MAG: tetratricopeptide repeat protein [Rhodocyclales bacterium]|nr:tetratricopeptide repeat protein [Rhodocyclales bacterium]